jgi:nucleoid-associated protein YgaU
MSATVLAAVAPRTLPRLEAIGDPARPAAEVTSFGLRLVATGFAVYVALVLLALLLATLRLVPATTRRAVDRWTTGGLAGGLRRLVGASAIVIGVLPLQPLAAPADPSPPVLAPADLPPGTAPRLEPLPPTTVVPPTTAPPVLHAPEPAPTPPPGDPQPTPTPGPLPALERSLTVAVGDSFWSIARHLVRDHLGRPPSDAEVIEPWLALISANRDRLVDATDPDLLYPGQVLRLPDP